MDNLFFCLNATGPIFLMMILGLFFRHIGWMDEEFASKMNKFVFKVPLPLLLFGSLECKICYILFYCNLDLHYNFSGNFLSLEG